MAGTSLSGLNPTVANLYNDLNDQNGLALIAHCTGTPDTTANVYQHGCLMYQTDSGTGNNAVWQNTGSSAVPAWTLLDTGTGGLSLPTTATDTTTTTATSLGLTQNTVTTGNGMTQSLNGLTTGKGHSITHTTSVISAGGTLLNLSSTGVDTTTTSGALLTLTSTLGVAATQVLGTFGTTTGLGVSFVAASQTSGTVLSVTGGGAAITSAGQVVLVSMGAATTGQGLQVTSTGTYTGLNGIVQATANSATTGTIVRFNGTGVTSGNVLYVVGGGANLATGGNIVNADAGAATAGSAILAQTSGTYIGTDGVLSVSATGTTSGLIGKIVAAAATLTTGRYLAFSDGALNVLSFGANGHIHTSQTTAPTVAVTVQNGITAAAITAGSTDVTGIITTTGTNNNGGATTITVTFNKTYTAAPKNVILFPANSAAAETAAHAAVAPAYIIQTDITATSFKMTIPQNAAAQATPSWTYLVIA